ncbi:MAG: diguanylate cyclase [Acholeplasmatales bacterium]|nr:diguanylate cyclase [Acholeplasmatales bacterium]
MVVLADIFSYIEQSPFIPVLFSGFILIIIILESLIKRKFLLTRFLVTAFLTFASVFMLIFHSEILKQKELVVNLSYIGMIAIEVVLFCILFTIVDLSFSNETFQKDLKKTINDTKLYVVLNNKDKIKEISDFFLNDLGIEDSEAIGKNFFDVIENKYRIVGLNGAGCLKAEVKKYYNKYGKKIQEGERYTMELNLQLSDGREDAFYFTETPNFSNGRYRGRVLFGEKKTEENLMALEKSELEAKKELELIKERFITIIGKTTDGIYFNTFNDGTIWFNDVLVKKLFLNGNYINADEFFKNVNPDDFNVYKEKVRELKEGDYHLSYRYNTGNYYVYVKEDGKKIVSGDTVELSGVMTVVDDYSFEKTGTILDQIGTEEQMLNKLRELYSRQRDYEIVHFKVTSIPEINQRYGRALGNMCLSQYVENFKNEFVDENLIYRVGGLEFVAIIISYNRIETLRTSLRNDEKILHAQLSYVNEKIKIDVNMGLAMSNEAGAPADVLKAAKAALNYSLNPKYTSSYVYYKDMKAYE